MYAVRFDTFLQRKPKKNQEQSMWKECTPVISFVEQYDIVRHGTARQNKDEEMKMEIFLVNIEMV